MSTATDYVSPETFEKTIQLSKTVKTPFLALDLGIIGKNYDDLVKNFSYAKIYYAVKANPNDAVLRLLISKGSNFDIATVFELDQMLSLGVSPDRISYGNTIKKEADVKYAYDKGIRLFVTDSESDMLKISRQAPGSKIFFRLLISCEGADWPLSKKFGAHPDVVYDIAMKAKNLGLVPYGLSFHVGSQQRDVGQWDNAISICKYMFSALKEKGIELKMINLGGGLPSNYMQPTPVLEDYAKEITRFLNEDFAEMPEIVMEPGRSLVAGAGIIVTEVIMVSKKSKLNGNTWVYLDIGKFGGLIETLDEAIRYPIFTESGNAENNVRPVILAGPTCDSMDILYEKNKYSLPRSIKEGDRLYIMTTGAYTSSYSSICFNGIPPLRTYILQDIREAAAKKAAAAN